jgi:N-acetyl-alpha-D-muramate 1-phosphate uridylyltransferase
MAPVPPVTTPPKRAMVLAAGLGTRMRPFNGRLPKPLVSVGGKALIDYVLDRLAEQGVERAVVNVHHLADQIERHLAQRERPDIVISDERDELLGTGGGVLKALPLLGENFFVVNSDVLWLDGKVPALERLARAWSDEADAMLLLQRTTTAVGYDGVGDYFLDKLGVPRYRDEREIAPYIFAGVQLLSRRLFAEASALPAKFSLARLYHQAEAAGRLRGIVHDGEWYHIGTPDGLAAAEERLSASRIER